jgi:hypothetical protein
MYGSRTQAISVASNILLSSAGELEKFAFYHPLVHTCKIVRHIQDWYHPAYFHVFSLLKDTLLNSTVYGNTYLDFPVTGLQGHPENMLPHLSYRKNQFTVLACNYTENVKCSV